MILILLFLLFLPWTPRSQAPSADHPACATASPIASPVAMTDACSWTDLVERVDLHLLEQSGDPFTFGEPSDPEPSTALPDGWIDGAVWRVELPNGGGFHWVALLQFEDAQDLEQSSEAHSIEMDAAGYVAAIAPDPAGSCFSLIREESARAVCSTPLGTLMIVGYSFFEVDHPDGQIQTAIALVEIVREAVDGVAPLG